MMPSKSVMFGRPPQSETKARKLLLDQIHEFCENDEEIMLADGFEEAFIGVVSGCGRPTVACYDYEKCVAVLEKRDEMDRESAEEWMDFNVTGAWVGEKTPLFLTRFRKRKL
jgi:hypothetical protein